MSEINDKTVNVLRGFINGSSPMTLTQLRILASRAMYEITDLQAQLTATKQWKAVAESRGEEIEQLQLLLAKNEPEIHAIKEELRVTRDGHESWRSSAMSYKSTLDEVKQQLTATKRAADCMAALERLLNETSSTFLIVAKAPYQIIDHDNEPKSIREIVLGEGQDLLSAIEAAGSQGEGE